MIVIFIQFQISIFKFQISNIENPAQYSLVGLRSNFTRILFWSEDYRKMGFLCQAQMNPVILEYDRFF